MRTLATFTPPINTSVWYPDKSDLTRWVYDIMKYLEDTPIPTEEVVAAAVDKYLIENPITEKFYTSDNPPPYPVTSVNGQTGAVSIQTGSPDAYTPTNPPPYPVTSVNGQTGAVTLQTGSLDAYTPTNPPPYPVTSVNGQTGAVSIQTGSLDAYTPTNQPPYPVTKVFGLTGDIGIATALSGVEENVDYDKYITGFSIISGGENGTLPAGNSIKRFLIFDTPLVASDIFKFIPVSRSTGIYIVINDTGPTRDGGGYLSFTQIATLDADVSYSWEIIYIGSSGFRFKKFLRYIP